MLCLYLTYDLSKQGFLKDRWGSSFALKFSKVKRMKLAWLTEAYLSSFYPSAFSNSFHALAARIELMYLR